MKSALAACLAVLVSAPLGCAQRSDPAESWTVLLEGQEGLDHWQRVGDANWRAEAGAIVADAGKGGYLVSRRSFRDFHLVAEFWAAPGTNSGIFVRLSDSRQVGSKSGYEVNIFDQAPDPAYGTGAIVRVAPVSSRHLAGAQWNVMEIRAAGPRLTVTLNGVRTVDSEHGRFTEGPLALQYRKGPIKWRKVHVRPL